MINNTAEKIHRINNLFAEIDSMYHHAALKLGVSDSVMRILYTVYDNGESCLLSDIYKRSGISKQTVNSALRKLEEEDILYLEPYKGRSKKVVLTESGKEYVSKTAKQLHDAEISAFENWGNDKIDTHILLLEEYIAAFKEQLKTL